MKRKADGKNKPPAFRSLSHSVSLNFLCRDCFVPRNDVVSKFLFAVNQQLTKYFMQILID
jgi:hypothetical protein